MIILLTGNMGTDKTSKVIQMIIDNEDKLAEMPVYDTDGKTILDWIKCKAASAFKLNRARF